MSSRSKSVLWAFALALTSALIIFNTALSHWNTNELVAGERASRESREVIDATSTLFSTVKDAETGQRGYLLTHDDQYLKPYQLALERVMSRLGDLKSKLADNVEQSARIPALEAAMLAKLDDIQRTVALEQSGQHDQALAVVRGDKGRVLMEDIRTRIEEICANEARLQHQRDLHADQLHWSTDVNRLVGTLIALSLIGFSVLVLRRDFRARARAADDLFIQKEWLATTLRGIGDAVVVTDKEGRVVLLNPVAEQLTGWSRDEAAGKPLIEVFDIVVEETRDRAADPVARALATGKVVGLANHTVLRSRDGSEYVIEDSAAPTYDQHGKIQGAVMVFHDSTLRRQTERALALSNEEASRRAEAALVSERILHTILENAPIGISLTDASEGYPIVAMSRQMRDWVGAGSDARAGREAYRKILPDGSVPSAEMLPLSRAMRDGTHVRSEHWLIERRGQQPLTVLVDVAPIVDAAGRIVGAINIWIDETERRRLDRALRMTESRLLVLVRSNVIGLILNFNRDGKVRDANAAFLDMLGFTPADIFDGAIDLTALTPPEYREIDLRAFEEMRNSDASTPYEKELLRKDGTRISVVVGYARMAEARDEYVGFALDISERKRLEGQLRQQAEQLIEADRRKNEFLAMLSHELRNPVAPLRNAIYLLEEPGSDSQAVERLLPMMRRQIELLVRLIDDLLDAARITQGKIALEKHVVELAPILDSAIETVQPLLHSQGHSLQVHSQVQPLFVLGDSARLAQMFSNILHNAAKYTPRNGAIDVSIERDGVSAVVRVRDNGQGIDARLLPHIFDIFTQADQSLARSSGGIGVGLALVRRIAELHGGRVTATSAGVNQGSEFVMQLPLVDAPGAREPAADDLPVAQLRDLRILIVDDNVDLAGSTAALLDMWGYSTHVVHTGKDALSAMRAIKPQVLIMDIGLPEMDGFEVLRRLRDADQLAGVFSIAMTGYGQDRDKLSIKNAGFDAHLVKPVHPRAIKQLLDRL